MKFNHQYLETYYIFLKCSPFFFQSLKFFLDGFEQIVAVFLPSYYQNSNYQGTELLCDLFFQDLMFFC